MVKTRHIGKAGELLVQYKLIKYGIDSSVMTTDAGIDLVAYSPRNTKAYTIQVKTQEKALKSQFANYLIGCNRNNILNKNFMTVGKELVHGCN